MFPKKAVITAGMPYGDKSLHFGHIGGNLLHADIYARFLRNRIGEDNVIFVSGTDCYGAGIVAKHEALQEQGSLTDFVAKNHKHQKDVLEKYAISPNLYAASGLEPAGSVHAELSAQLFELWYKNGYLHKKEVLQFYDEKEQVFLNGRQVEGRCPIDKCKSESAYADECSLGHQFSPSELIAPKIVSSGEMPSLKLNTNWYFDLQRFEEELNNRQKELQDEGISRKFMISYINDFLKKPEIIIKIDDFDKLPINEMPKHSLIKDEKSAVLVFEKLDDREISCKILLKYNIRFRTGTALVPFRISGNVSWGIPVPDKDNITGQTFWCWPESLWAPISFTKTLKGEYESWWFNPDSKVYQFIGEDNIYFYAIAGIGLFMAINESNKKNLPTIIPNRHIFFGNRKAASSGALKAPNAEELLNKYTPEQLRMHFAHMSLGTNSIKFLPKAFLGEEGFDATLAEGNILTNVYNRLIRSCFYTLQKYFNGKMPEGETTNEAENLKLIDEYELAMYKFEFPKAIDLIDAYLRDISKIWAANTKSDDLRGQTLIDTFQAVRIAAVLLNPFAPIGTEIIREYLQFDKNMFNWDYIRKPFKFFINKNHEFKFLEPKFDFFAKHPAQLGER